MPAADGIRPAVSAGGEATASMYSRWIADPLSQILPALSLTLQKYPATVSTASPGTRSSILPGRGSVKICSSVTGMSASTGTRGRRGGSPGALSRGSGASGTGGASGARAFPPPKTPLARSLSL